MDGEGEYFPEERAALLELRDYLNYSNSDTNLHKNWTGPPCYKNQSRWAGIACSGWHVSHLVLDGIHLTGPLPPSFHLHDLSFLTKLSFSNNSISGPLPDLSNLPHLQFVLLSRNRFSGPIPLHYIHLRSLTELELQDNSLNGSIPPFNQPTLTLFNVSYNHLEGPIPPTPVLQRFPKSSFDHNLNLCGYLLAIPCPMSPPRPSPSNKGRRKLKLWSILVIGAAAAVLVLFSVLVLLFFCYRRRHPNAERGQPPPEGYVWDKRYHETQPSSRIALKAPEEMVESSCIPTLEICGRKRIRKQGKWTNSNTTLELFDKERWAFDLGELLRAPAEVMGKGELGTTYKAMMESGPLAVKRLSEQMMMRSLRKKEFVQQMRLLGNMRDENLVQIISFYYSREEKLLIYEFVAEGSFFHLLHENRGPGRVALKWSARVSIIKGIAKGLAFLHESLASQQVPHGNLKSSNVLVHRRNGQNYQSKLTDYGLLPFLPSPKWQKLAVGICPEFSRGKKMTYKADVYCFGIILLEAITGKIPAAVGEADQIFESSSTSTIVEDLADWARRAVNNDWSTDILDLEIVSSKEHHSEMLRFTQIALDCIDMVPEKRPNMSEILRRIELLDQ
ncbi:Non-specific serine/threonine protein kinase [Bertholletia excelsa]